MSTDDIKPQRGETWQVTYTDKVGPEGMLSGNPFNAPADYRYWVSPQFLREKFGATVELVPDQLDLLAAPIGDASAFHPTSPADLFDLVADALDMGGFDDPHARAFAKSVMRVVQPELDGRDAEIRRLTTELAEARAQLAQSHEINEGWVQYGERVKQQKRDWRQRVTALESQLASRPAIPADAVAPGVVNHIRPVKVSADRVEVEVSTRLSDGTTRAYVREWGRKGGCRQVGLILTDEKRAELVARLSAPVSGSDTTTARLDCGCGHPETPFGTDTSWMCDRHRPSSSAATSRLDSCMALVPDGPEDARPCDGETVEDSGRCEQHQCDGSFTCPAAVHDKDCFVCPAELLNARVQIWFCPIVEHREHGADRPVTVEWRDGVAHCTAPDCGHTSAETREESEVPGIVAATPVWVYRSETNFATYRTPGADALIEVYNPDKDEWQSTRWESLEALAGKCGPMTEVTGP